LIKITDSTIVEKTTAWALKSPDPSFDWNCKYKIWVDPAAEATFKSANPGKPGYLTV
jgi:hypothetical protein